MQQINYGVDAPKIIRNLFSVAAVFYTLSVFFYLVKITLLFSVVAGSICFIEGLLMILYARKGKFRQRDRILKLINWSGNESVLDVGTGLGLLMNGAAKKLTSGKSIGIDIWNNEDLSNNSSEKTLLNAELEGVADKIEIKDENILHTNFQDNYFDVVLSNLCLHNIKGKESRKIAYTEIHRILKRDGTVIISDFMHSHEYKKEFRRLGMITEKVGTYYFDTFPPLTIIKAIKK